MKKPILEGILLTVAVVGVLICVFASQIQNAYFPKRKLTVKAMDDRGIFVGDGSKVFVEKPKRIDQDIDYVWDQIHIGNSHRIAGRFQEAVEYYEKASHGLHEEIDGVTPGRALGAKYLIETYEKLGRFDEALKVLEILDKKFYKGENGLKESAEIRARLLAAKSHTNEK